MSATFGVIERFILFLFTAYQYYSVPTRVNLFVSYASFSNFCVSDLVLSFWH